MNSNCTNFFVKLPTYMYVKCTFAGRNGLELTVHNVPPFLNTVEHIGVPVLSTSSPCQHNSLLSVSVSLFQTWLRKHLLWPKTAPLLLCLPHCSALGPTALCSTTGWALLHMTCSFARHVLPLLTKTTAP